MRPFVSILLVLTMMAPPEGLCQSIKIATIDLAYVYANLAAHKRLMAEIDSSSTKYQTVIQEKLAAYQQKLQAYQKLGKETPEPLLKDKAAELESIQAAMQQFQENAEKDLRAKYSNRFPDIEKTVKATITECGKEYQVTYITRSRADFNAGESRPFLLYSGDTQTDLTDDVLSKLGVTAHPEKGRPRKSVITK